VASASAFFKSVVNFSDHATLLGKRKIWQIQRDSHTCRQDSSARAAALYLRVVINIGNSQPARYIDAAWKVLTIHCLSRTRRVIA